jgi:curved DNA-binding protein CbpA
MSFNLSRGLFQLNITDHYAILGVSLKTNTKEIRKRYLKIAQRLHPDTCKSKTDHEKHLANQLLSKLVNPAYEVLSKENSKAEHLLIITAIGERLAQEGGKMSINFASTKELLTSGFNFQYVYDKLLIQLALQQYRTLDDSVFSIIEEISELNLAYSIIQANHEKRKQQQRITETQHNNITSSKTIIQKVSPIANNLNRAKQYMQGGNYTQAVAELKEALKLEPNSSTVYGLLGMAYLRQNQVSMAKIYVKKASELDPKNPMAIQSKNELNKLIPTSKQTGYNKTTNPGKSDQGGGGLFGGLFGGKKK